MDVDTGRVEAFSDGVFAVAITLLVLDLNVAGPPRATNGSLAAQLGHLWPNYAAYVVSFLVIGILWVNHHALFAKIGRTDRPLLFLNLLLLMAVALLPFPTRTLAVYLRHGSSWDARVAAALYSAVMWGVGLAFTGIYLWAGRGGLLHESVEVDEHRSAFRQFGLGSFAYPVIIGLAFVNAEVALLGHFVLAVFYVVDRTSVVAGAAPAGPDDPDPA